MLKIKIDLTRLSAEDAQQQNIKSCYYLNREELTAGDNLARDILAPLAVAELMRTEGNETQKKNAQKLGDIFGNCSSVCGSALWFLGDREERQALTLADGFAPDSFGITCRGGCFILILENDNEEERAYLVRFNW